MPARRTLAAALGLVLLVGLLAAPSGAPPALAGPATSTPPPTPIPPSGSPSPFPTTLRTPPPSPHPPRLTAREAILEDASTGQVLYAKRPDTRRPVASLTKIMTALLVLRTMPPDRIVVVGRAAAAQPPSDMGLRPGERISVRDLLYGLLVSSGNDAAVALAVATAGGQDAFVDRMNSEAAALGLTRTRFASPSGLNDAGLSTARDIARITRAADRLPLFRQITATRQVVLPAPRRGTMTLQNRNALLWLYPGATGTKTGFTTAAGWCLVAQAGRGDRSALAVVLDAPTEGSVFSDAAALLNYGLREFEPYRLAVRGRAVASLSIDGVPFDVAASGGRTTLLRRDLVGRVRHVVRPAAGLRLPVRAGQFVAVERVLAGKRKLATVRLTAVRSVPAPPALPASPVAGPAVGAEPPLRVAASVLAFAARGLGL